MESLSHEMLPEDEYPKLVRDNIPDIIKARTGSGPEQRTAESDAEFETFLLKKIAEEADELRRAAEKGNVEEEIADINELLETLMRFKDMKAEEVARIQVEKRERNGGFEKRIIMLSKVPKPEDPQ